MTTCFIGLSREISAGEVISALQSWFPAVTISSILDTASKPGDIVIDIVTSSIQGFPSLVQFYYFPGTEVDCIGIGIGLCALFSSRFNLTTISDGSGLGDDPSPYWLVLYDQHTLYLADDSGTDPDDERPAGPVLVIRPLALPIPKFEPNGMLKRV